MTCTLLRLLLWDWKPPESLLSREHSPLMLADKLGLPPRRETSHRTVNHRCAAGVPMP